MRTRRLAFAAVLVLLIGVAWLGSYLSHGAAPIATDLSPDRQEQVRFYTATRWQRLLDSDADLLGYVTLYDVAHRTVIASSSSFELSGHSEVLWRSDRVQVASSAVFDRTTKRWTVLQ